MKTSILKLTITTFLASAILTSCNNSSQKTEKAEANVLEANKVLEKANEEYLADIKNYRKLIAEQMKANDNRIVEFNGRIFKKKKELREGYQEKVNTLDLKNSDMKKKIAEYKANGKADWELFKAEFNQGMLDLGTAFNDLTNRK